MSVSYDVCAVDPDRMASFERAFAVDSEPSTVLPALYESFGLNPSSHVDESLGASPASEGEELQSLVHDCFLELCCSFSEHLGKPSFLRADPKNRVLLLAPELRGIPFLHASFPGPCFPVPQAATPVEGGLFVLWSADTVRESLTKLAPLRTQAGVLGYEPSWGFWDKLFKRQVRFENARPQLIDDWDSWTTLLAGVDHSCETGHHFGVPFWT
ncbi:MAG: hypothetical protein AAFS11_02790 [Planctomycetota bacterium]